MGVKGAKLKATDDQIAKKLIDTRGCVTYVANHFKVDRKTISRRIDASPRLQEVLQECRDRQLDHTEAMLFTQIDDGDFKAIRFYLITQGRSRGYIESIPSALTAVSLDALVRLLRGFNVEASADEIIEKVAEIDNEFRRK